MIKMAAEILDGKKVAEKAREKIKNEVKALKRKPGLAVILVGEDPASKIYVKMKERACAEVGYYSEKHVLKEDISQEEVLELIKKLNEKSSIDGILIQIPMPKHLNESKILNSVLPEKDVDGFSWNSLGKIMSNEEEILPATPKGIIRLLDEYGIAIEGKNAVIVGRSKIVGRPLALMLLNRNATVTVCHTKTKNLEEHTKNADILVAACGVAKMIKKNMVKKGAVVIDVGTNKTEFGLCGDVDFEAVKDVAGYITPVPGGVGPMTIAMLIENTLELARMHDEKNNL